MICFINKFFYNWFIWWTNCFTAQSTENASIDDNAKNAQFDHFIYGSIERSQSLACDLFSDSSPEQCSTTKSKIDISNRQLLSKPAITYTSKQKSGEISN